MPELPEVETIARGLAHRVTGEVIKSVWLGSKPEPFKSSPAQIVTTLESSRIAGVRRAGKHIVFDLDRVARTPPFAKVRKRGKGHSQEAPSQWIVHLGMTGKLLLCGPETEIAKHTHAIVGLASGRELRFVDARRFGRLSVADSFEAAGAEPLEIELERFLTFFHSRKTPIKSALLNQTLLSGVGNIYADESLFRAGIRPRRRATSLTKKELIRLFLSLREVLKEAIAAGGSSVSDYVNSDGEAGLFQFHHRVYGREGEPCLVCKSPIKRIVIAGRSSHYCPHCQR
ncbi:MAG: bifunctional DNA-formamidopyrimidine glycosylase/DNA-(apurinic or apyrimidinic site) lyase [Terriglobales bacterium]